MLLIYQRPCSEDNLILVEDAPERSYAETAADAPGNLDTPTAAVYEPLVI